MGRALRDRPSRPDPMVIGGPRRKPIILWIGFLILVPIVALMTAVFWDFREGDGPWPVPIVWLVGALCALGLLIAREVRLAPEGITVTRHLLGLRWERRHVLRHVRAVCVEGRHAPSRHQRSDGTPEGDARLLAFTVRLVGRPRLVIGFSRDAAAMETLARQAAALLGVPALRQGYALGPPGSVPVLRPRRATEPLP